MHIVWASLEHVFQGEFESIVLRFQSVRTSEKKSYALHKDAFIIEGAEVSEMMDTHAVEHIFSTQGWDRCF